MKRRPPLIVSAFATADVAQQDRVAGSSIRSGMMAPLTGNAALLPSAVIHVQVTRNGVRLAQ